jgi:hypothetical protein
VAVLEFTYQEVHETLNVGMNETLVSIYALKHRLPSVRHTYRYVPKRMAYVPCKACQECHRLRETLPHPIDEGAYLYGRDLPAERYATYILYKSSPRDPKLRGRTYVSRDWAIETYGMYT